jgi:hypothetical protein
MHLRRLSIAAALSATALLLTASVAAADPPWSPPSPLTGAANGPAVATPRGNVVAFTSSDRTQPPGTASQLLRLDPATGAVRSAAGVDIAGTAIAPYGSDHVAVAGTSIGPSGTVDDRSRVRVGTAVGGSAGRRPCARSRARRARTSRRSPPTSAATSRCPRAAGAPG